MPPSIVLISGCSSGIGLLTAARLAAAGHIIYATMRNLAKQGPLLAEVAKRKGEVRLLPLDVADDRSISQAIARVHDECGKLDVLVNNAGYALGGVWEDLQESEVRAQMETNFFGVRKLICHSLRLLRNSDNAKIINVSSIAGVCALPGIGAYCASKFALEGFSESLRHELKSLGIAVSLIEPGSYLTKIWTENYQLGAKIDRQSGNWDEWVRPWLSAIQKSLNRMGDPEDVARLLEKVINKKNPAMRYRCGWDARVIWLLRAVLPFDWYSWLLCKGLRS